MIDLEPAAARMGAVLDRVRDVQLRGRTPCRRAAVGDLVVHVDQVARGAVALAARDEGGMLAAATTVADGSRLGSGWRADVRAHLDAAVRAWRDPATWDVARPVPGSALDAPTWAGITLTELVVHAWDLAVATGQQVEWPEATLRACWDHVRVFVPAAPFDGLWSDPVPVAEDAPLLDRILATTGRDPSRWSGRRAAARTTDRSAGAVSATSCPRRPPGSGPS